LLAAGPNHFAQFRHRGGRKAQLALGLGSWLVGWGPVGWASGGEIGVH
jgi:hypothetical protein